MFRLRLFDGQGLALPAASIDDLLRELRRRDRLVAYDEIGEARVLTAHLHACIPAPSGSLIATMVSGGPLDGALDYSVTLGASLFRHRVRLDMATIAPTLALVRCGFDSRAPALAPGREFTAWHQDHLRGSVLWFDLPSGDTLLGFERPEDAATFKLSQWFKPCDR